MGGVGFDLDAAPSDVGFAAILRSEDTSVVLVLQSHSQADQSQLLQSTIC